MRNILTSGESKIVIEREDEGMGIYYKGPIPPQENLDPIFQESYSLLEELIEYLEKPEKLITRKIENLNIHNISLVDLPEETPSWIISETPYTWKGKVIVSWDSLKYYEDLRLGLLDKAGHEKSEVSQIVYLRRAASCKDIVYELQKSLVKLPKIEE